MTRPALLNCIGNTPLLPLKRPPGVSTRVELWGKAEWFNPGGSVKDRAALFIVRDAQARGLLSPGKTLLDATSGNTGIAYAMLGAVLGFPVELVMPANVNVERKQIVRAYGANLTLTDPLEGSDGAILRARELAQDVDKYFYADQYNNPANVRAHLETTAPEIWQQTNGRITHFVAGVGTSGSLMGNSHRLRQFNPAIQIIEVQPADELNIIEGLKHMETAIVPGIYDPARADRHFAIDVTDAFSTARHLARNEGLFVGLSAGAAVRIAYQVAQGLDEGVIVALLPDGGERYISTV